MRRSAVLSEDGLYRYSLVRRWSDEDAFATFIMLNPSVADAEVDDPTIRRCIGFAQRWGMGALHVLNLYALRTPYPTDLWKADDPVGPENDTYLLRHAQSANLNGWPMIAAWGNNAKKDRVDHLLYGIPWVAPTLTCLGTTLSGAPKHPLARGKHRVPGDFEPVPWPESFIEQARADAGV